MHLSFPSAYSGTLRLYAIDWDSTDRRESVTVDDGTGPHTVNITTDFSQGAWMTFPVTVTAGRHRHHHRHPHRRHQRRPLRHLPRRRRTALHSPPPPPPLYTSAPQGSWVDTYGSQGYALAGWNGGE